MTGNRELTEARRALDRLHLGAGVRHERLHARLGPSLRRIWRITATDAPGVLAQTIVRLEQSLAGLSPSTVRIAQAAYHLRPDPSLDGHNYLDRLRVLSAELGRGHAQRTLERRLGDVRDHVAGQLERNWGPIPSGAVSEVLDRERAGADDSPLLDAIGRLQNPRALAELAITKFLKSEMWIPRSAENAFALARTAEHGDWICAFTSIPRLAEYQRKANPPWPGAPITLTGANLLRKMREQRLRVGVLVNPQADPNPDLGATLPLPPEVVDKITADLG